ncbi:MAG TPA: hypothetical protein VGQ65_14130 [Thermoanaerobaculia bacterium]|jgi:hypothetical protein|nr:hypothetical protein [Thermoanaerobaculia bacterium]
MNTLHPFERVILAWALIGVIAAGPVSANKLASKRPRPADSVNFVVVPQGTQTVTVTWAITPAILPDREWNCGNGHGGFIDFYTYTPDQWVMNVYDLTTSATVAHQEGTSVPLLYSCSGSAPTATSEIGSMQVDVSSLTANGDTTFLAAMGTTGEERTATPGGASEYFVCGGPWQAVTVNATVSFPLRSIIFDSACSASANAGRRTAQASRSGVVKLDDPPSCDIHDPQKLLTYIAPSDTKADGTPNYPSPFQRWKNDPNDHFNGVTLGDKPQMFIRGKANGVQPGKKIWLKLIDPPDLSAYVAQVSPSTGNDNKDDSAKLYGADGHHAKTGKALPVVVDSDSRFEVVLEGAKNDAGDNYKVMASLAKPDDNDVFACEATSTCTLTPEITVWKRQYFEQAQMVTQGAFLAQNIVGSTESCTTSNPCVIHFRSVDVDDRRVIRPGTQLTLMSMGPIGTSVAGAPFHEDVTVDANLPSGKSVLRDDDGTWAVRLTSRPQNNYYGHQQTSRVSLDAVAVRDDSGVINAFSINSGVAKNLLKDAFIEYADAAPVAWPYIPYVGVANEGEEALLGKRWFQHASRGFNPVAEPYHRLIVAAKRADVRGDCSTNLGRTHREEDNDSWRLSVIYEYTLQLGATNPFRRIYTLSPDQGDTRLPLACIDKTVAGLYHRDATTVEQLDVAHEVVHQYGVNTPAPPGVTKGHCNRQEYTGHFICLMNQTWPGSAVDAQITLDGAKLHYLPGGVDSEYTDVRKLMERNP